MEALLYGSLIGATDTVGAITVMTSKEVNAQILIQSLVFGESALNDAVAIVLYQTVDGLRSAGSLTPATMGLAVADFLKKSLGSTFIGIAFGVSLTLLLK